MGVRASLRFYSVQLGRFRPRLLAALVTSSSLLVFSTASYLVNIDLLTAEQAALALQSQPWQTPAESQAPLKAPDLPPFDSVTLVSAIDRASVAMKVTSDALTFALEDGAGQPYRRYRASLAMLGRYPHIRAAIVTVLQEVPYSSLDSIKCTRDDIAEVDVNCTVTMSVFYQRAHSR